MEMSDTPRSTAKAFYARWPIGFQREDGGLVVDLDVAQEMERELLEAQEIIKDADADCASHNRYTVEESLRAAEAIRAAEKWSEGTYANWRDRIWWIEQMKEITRLRATLEAVKADTALHAGAGPTYTLVCNTLSP